MRSSFALLLATVAAFTIAACGAADTTDETGQNMSIASEEDALIVSCSKNDQCGVGSYCKLKACAAPGTCAPRPAGCTLEYMPVCGCDGRTYGNACAAARAGASVRHTGKCVGVH